MTRFQMFRYLARGVSPHFPVPGPSRTACISIVAPRQGRRLSSSVRFFRGDGRQGAPTSIGENGSSEHEGSFARTDKDVRVEYPEEHDLPSSVPVQGRGGLHFKRTLASFSLEGRVGVVTGGARGLGLVMSQALVVSGADVAIVDLNSESLR